MLQTPLVVSIITAISSLILFWTTSNFYDKLYKAENEQQRKKVKNITILFSVITLISTAYFSYNSSKYFFDTNILELILAFVVFSIIIGIIVIYQIDKEKEEKKYWPIAIILIALLCMLFCFSVMGIHLLIEDNQYNKNVIAVETPKYEEQEFKLVPIFDENKEYENIKISTSYIQITPYDKFKFYYTESEQIKEYEVDKELIQLVELKEKEEPYVKLKKTITYSIDNNKNPPEECNFEEEYEFELHLQLKDISKLLGY